MDRDSTFVIRSVARTRDRLQSTVETLDTTFLKRVGVLTYFGVYAVIAFGGRRAVNGVVGALPPIVRPPALVPLHEVLGLPRSVAWALVSFATALTVICVLIAVSLRREAGDRPPRLGGDSIRRTFSPGARVRWGGRRIRRALTTASEPTDDDRPSPSFDAGSSFSFDPTDEAPPPAAPDGDDGAELDVDEEPPTVPRDGSDGGGDTHADGKPEVGVSAAATVGTGVDQRTVDVGDTSIATEAGTVDDAEILTDDESADGPSTSDAGGDADREAAGESADGVDRDVDGESLDEVAPWPDEPDTADAEAFDEDAEWPGGWISGDEL